MVPGARGPDATVLPSGVRETAWLKGARWPQASTTTWWSWASRPLAARQCAERCLLRRSSELGISVSEPQVDWAEAVGRAPTSVTTCADLKREELIDGEAAPAAGRGH